MKDRLTRASLVVIAISLATLALQSVINKMPSAHAQLKPNERCYWTWLKDDGSPDLAKDGEIELKAKDWQKVSVSGWQLKAVHQDHYIFEKCGSLESLSQ